MMREEISRSKNTRNCKFDKDHFLHSCVHTEKCHERNTYE